MFGGLLEYASLIVGYRSLLIVVALLYGAAFLTGRKELGATVPGRAVAEPVPAGAGGGAGTGVD
jgi:hypothetical protein